MSSAEKRRVASRSTGRQMSGWRHRLHRWATEPRYSSGEAFLLVVVLVIVQAVR